MDTWITSDLWDTSPMIHSCQNQIQSSVYCSNQTFMDQTRFKQHFILMIAYIYFRILLAFWQWKWNLRNSVPKIPLPNKQHHLQCLNISDYSDCFWKVTFKIDLTRIRIPKCQEYKKITFNNVFCLWEIIALHKTFCFGLLRVLGGHSYYFVNLDQIFGFKTLNLDFGLDNWKAIHAECRS